MVTPRQRVKLALEHKEPDRIPIDYKSTPEAKAYLKKYLNITTDNALLKRLGVDFRYISPNYIGPKDRHFNLSAVEASGRDIWGVERRPVKNVYGEYMEIFSYPLQHIENVEQVENYLWPKIEWFDFDSILKQIEELEEDDEYSIKIPGGSVLENSWFMRGMDRFLMDLVVNQEMANKIMEKVLSFWISIISESNKAAKGRIDMVNFGDDVGGQEGMLISMDIWRKMIKPWHEKIIAKSHDLGLKTNYHSCGSIKPIIEDLVGIGLDVLNPLQFSPKGFPPPEKLKTRYGERLCFEGGMDVQTVLPFYSAEEIEKEAEKLIRVLGKNGGYIINSSHRIQPDTKPENIMAMYDTALRYSY